MPSASSKPQANQNSTLDLLQEPVKSAISVVDKKLRNLEKRRLKLLETKKKADKGEKLNDDQKNAVKSLESVDFGLEAVKDVQKNMQSIEQEYAKLLKKDQKRQKQEQRDQTEICTRKNVLEVVEVQAILGELSEDVRPDFLSGSNGACELTEDDFTNLDNFYELINIESSEEKSKKLSERVKVASGHLLNLITSSSQTVFEKTTYKDIQEILMKVKTSGYFDNESSDDKIVEEAPKEEPAAEEDEQKPEGEPEVPVVPESESPEEEYPISKEAMEESVSHAPVNGVDLPPEVQETPEEEGFKFMGDSEITTSATQEPALNPVSPEFVPRNMQYHTEEGNGDNNGGDSNWQVEGGHSNNQGGNHRGRGRGRGGFRGRGGRGGGYRGGSKDGGNYRGGRGGGRGGGGNYRGNREGGRGSGGFRGGRGGRGGGRGGHNYQQQPPQ